VPEIVDQGVTGIVVDSVEKAAAAVPLAAALDRARVRATFDRRFSIERVAADNLTVYQSLSSRDRPFS
jgi:hypothetical protein